MRFLGKQSDFYHLSQSRLFHHGCLGSDEMQPMANRWKVLAALYSIHAVVGTPIVHGSPLAGGVDQVAKLARTSLRLHRSGLTRVQLPGDTTMDQVVAIHARSMHLGHHCACDWALCEQEVSTCRKSADCKCTVHPVLH